MRHGYTVLALPDIHFRERRGGIPEGEDRKTIANVLKYLKDEPVDEVVLIGDVLDFPYFSIKWENKVIDEAFAWAHEDLKLTENFLLTLGQSCERITWLEGNHDMRWQPYLRKHKAERFADKADPTQVLPLADLKVKYIPFWRNKRLLHKVGKAYFMHGRYVNLHHASKHARTYPGMNIFYGHGHDVQSWSPVVFGDHSTTIAQSLGMLCRYDQPYLEGDPTNWQQAFTKFHFHADGTFQYYLARIFKHRFIAPGGKSYA